MFSPEIFITEDGSSSLISNFSNESYHSRFGAVSESRHIFLKSGFKTFRNFNKLTVLEIGFGTGLNALLTLLDCTAEKFPVLYHTIEPFPLPEFIYESLNYPEILNLNKKDNLFHLLHKTVWECDVMINEFFSLRKQKIKLQDIQLLKNHYNIIYFDAFSPEVQPELWTTEVFQKLYESLQNDGLLVTYSAKGSVRRALKATGFKVERIAGPKGKREITRAKKNNDPFSHY